jgi:hypothetical protein
MLDPDPQLQPNQQHRKNFANLKENVFVNPQYYEMSLSSSACLIVQSLVLVAASRMTTLSAEDLGTDTVTLTGCTPQLFRLAIVRCISDSFLPVQLSLL